MDNIIITRQGADANGITLEEALCLIIVNEKIDVNRILYNLCVRSFIGNINTSPVTYFMLDKGTDSLKNTILDSLEVKTTSEDLHNLAIQLKEIFPKGKKPGTNYYWADGVAIIEKRLKLFFRKYGETYSCEQIVQAAKDYVDSFNGNYTYMKLLKYFILKEKVGAAGDQESESELINYIENAGQETNNSMFGRLL